MEPVDSEGKTLVPRQWRTVYDEGLLHRTALLLSEQSEHGIAVPGDLQRLIDAVYAEDFGRNLDAASKRELHRMDIARQAEEAATVHLAKVTAICAPADLAGDLHALSRRKPGVTEELITTRLGAESGRIVCLYERADGVWTLDTAGKLPLARGDANGLSGDGLVRLLSHVAPVPSCWLRRSLDEEPQPKSWHKQVRLRDVVLLRMRSSSEGVWSCPSGDQEITITDVGLELG